MTKIHANQLQQDSNLENGRFLTFALGEEEFGIDIGFVTEIISMQPVFRLPEVPGYIRGIINLRGKITPVIDLRLKFKKDAIEDTERTCIVVIDTGEFSVGLIVDKVAEVMTIDSDDIAPPPDARTGIHNRYIKGISKAEDKVKLLLDCEQLFSENEHSEILKNSVKDGKLNA
jgi:purine-binding chemotaxis protein CheW